MSTLRVATYNIWGLNEPWCYTVERGIVRGAVPDSPATTMRLHGGIWLRRRLLIERDLEQAQPHLIGLQEVRELPAGRGASQADQIAQKLGYNCSFQPVTRVEDNGDPVVEGLAVLTKYAIINTRLIPFFSESIKPDLQQAALHSVLTGPHGQVDLIVCHLTPRSEDARVAAIEQLLDYVDMLPARRPLIVVGDFNAEPESQTIRTTVAANTRIHRLRDVWREANPIDVGPTMPSESAKSRLDYIFVGEDLEILGAERLGEQPDLDGFYPSDHLGIVATLRLINDSGQM